MTVLIKTCDCGTRYQVSMRKPPLSRHLIGSYACPLCQVFVRCYDDHKRTGSVVPAEQTANTTGTLVHQLKKEVE